MQDKPKVLDCRYPGNGLGLSAGEANDLEPSRDPADCSAHIGDDVPSVAFDSAYTRLVYHIWRAVRLPAMRHRAESELAVHCRRGERGSDVTVVEGALAPCGLRAQNPLRGANDRADEGVLIVAPVDFGEALEYPSGPELERGDSVPARLVDDPSTFPSTTSCFQGAT